MTRKEYYRANIEKASKNAREWYLANKQKAVETRKKWAAANLEKVREYKRKWAEANKDKAREYYEENRDRIKKRISEWAKKNPKKCREYSRLKNKRYRKQFPEKYRLIDKHYNAKRRAIFRNGKVKACKTAIRQLSLQTFCHWCSRILTPKNFHIDHVTPLSRGGAHIPENLVACCVQCNLSKKNKLYWEWDGELAS